VSGAAGAGTGGFGGAAAGGVIAGPIGAIVGAVIGAFAGRVGAEKTTALKYFGDDDTEMLIEMLFQSLERMDLVGHDMTQEDVIMAYRDLAKLEHPDKVKRLPSHTNAQHAQRVADATTKFGILNADTFLVCEWIKARDEKKDLWTDENLRQIHKNKKIREKAMRVCTNNWPARRKSLHAK